MSDPPGCEGGGDGAVGGRVGEGEGEDGAVTRQARGHGVAHTL